MQRLLDNGPAVHCKIAEPELVGHFSAAFAESPPLGPPPAWLFPDIQPLSTTSAGSTLGSPVYRSTRRSHIHKGGDTATICNWRPISLQLTVYKLYSALIARRIASWANASSTFSPEQKGFLAFDGCAEHNFLLQSMMTDSWRHKRNLLLTWLDLREAFSSVPHQLMLSLMKRLGLGGSVLDIIKDIYSHSTIVATLSTGKPHLRKLPHLVKAWTNLCLAKPYPDLDRVTERQSYSPEGEVAAQSPPTQGSTPTQEEGTPPPPPVPTSEETTLKLRRLDQALNLLRPNAVTRQSRQEGIPPPPTTLTQEEGTLLPQLREKALVILRMDNIQLWDPEEEILSPTLAGIYTSPSASPSPATVSERQHCSPGAGRDPQPQSQGDQGLRPREEGVISPPPTPPSPHQRTSPRAAVPERRHRSPRANAAARQPRTESTQPTPPPSPGPLPPPSRAPDRLARISIDPERADESLRQPFYQELTPFIGRQLGDFEWVAFEEVLSRWSAAIKEAVAAPRHRPPNRKSQWARRRRREQEAEPPADPLQPAEEQEQGRGRPNNRASGYTRRAARAKVLQKLYQANPGACMRRLLDNTPPVYCSIEALELVTHYAAAFAEHFPTGTQRTPERLGQPKRVTSSSPQSPQMKINARIPREWKHSTVTLIHKGGDVTSVRNWRPICLQLTLYKLYTAIIARRIASWAMETRAFSPAQKGFLAYDGCAEHNFLLRSMMLEARRNKRNLLLAWLDLRDAFGSVPHDLILLMMKRLGLNGSAIDINRGVKQGCPLSPILFNIALEGLLKLLATNTAGFSLAGCTINSLAYADDVCVIASSKPELQGLLYQCQTFTTWAGLVFNAKKCGSLCMFNEAPRLYVDHLYSPLLGMEVIPALTWDERYKYLGSPTGATRSPVDALQDLRNAILRDTGTVFGSELAEWQKLDAFRRFLFPRVTFALKVVFPGTKWCQKTDTALRTIIKRGLRLPTRTCTKYLYLSQALGGMGIPSVTDESHVSRLAQAFKFLADTRDPCLRDVAVHQLTDTVAKRARYLDPTKPDHLATFLNTSSSPGEGRAGDLQSLWSSARASLTHTEAIITLTQDSATIEASQHILTWDKCKDLYPRLREAIHTRYLRDLKRTADQGRAFEPRLLPRLSLSPRPTDSLTGK
eukprot:Em0007g1103a